MSEKTLKAIAKREAAKTSKKKTTTSVVTTEAPQDAEAK